jgi:hypothetical protein
MRTGLFIVAMAVMLGSSPAAADPLDQIISLARGVGYGPRVVARPEPVQYVSRNGDFAYFAGGVPAADELMHMDYGTLRNVAIAANADFDRWLASIPAGEVWRKHFETRAVDELLGVDENAPPSDEQRGEIVRVLKILDEAVADSDMNDLTRRDSARTLRASLRELVTPPNHRLVRQLSYNGRQLNRSLGTLSTGVTWQRYLALPDAIVAAMDRPPGDSKAGVDIDEGELRQILGRYDEISANPEYDMIASLPAFQATHERLTELVTPPPPNTPPPVPARTAEELPPAELETR